MRSNRLSTRISAIVCRMLVLAAAMAVYVLTGTYVCAADKGGKPKPDYRDSIANANTVYTSIQARSVIRYLQELEKTSPADSMRLYATEALLNYNWYLIQNREWYLCRKLLLTAREYCPPGNDRLLNQINTAIAGTKLYAGDYETAGQLLLRSKRYFEQTGDTTEWLKTCVNLGLYYSKIHKNAKALEYYEKVLRMADRKPYEMYYSIVTGYAANIEEDTIIGLSTFEKALRISLDNGHTYLLASNYDDLAHYYFRMENYHEALANARKSLQYSDRYNIEDIKRSVLSLMADIYYIQKNYVAAYRMESDYNDVIRKNSESLGRNIYSDLNMADSLTDWITTNVPLHASASKHSPKGDSSTLWITVALIMAAIAAITSALAFAARRKLSVRTSASGGGEDTIPPTDRRDDMIPANDSGNIPDAKPENNNEDTSADENLKNAENTGVTSSFMTDAAALNTIAGSFNPALDRIRAMLKDIPKSGNQDIDSRLRNLQTLLLQSRLPETSNTLSADIRKTEEEFTGRLSVIYPSLTRSDLRMALYVKYGLGVQQISTVTGMQPKSVNQARYRLRKALGLGQDDSLEDFLKSF